MPLIEKLTKLASELIAIKSDSGNIPELTNAIKYVQSYLSQNTNIITNTYTSNNIPSLIAKPAISNPEIPTIIFTGHLDVVPGEDNQYTAHITGDKLIGRGSLDMKGAIAVMAKIIVDTTPNDNANLILALTCDEEVGGYDGSKYLLEKQNLTGDVVILPDGGHKFNIANAQKGILDVALKGKGKSAHGARPWLGENAIENLIHAATDIRNLFDNPTAENDWRKSINFGKILGGTATNKIPDTSQLDIDIRFTENDAMDELTEKIKNIANKYNGDIEILFHEPLFYVDPSNKYVQGYKHAAEMVLKRELTLYGEAGASDARFFSEKGIPTIVSWPVGADHHGPNEWVSINSLEDYYNILTIFIKNISTSKA